MAWQGKFKPFTKRFCPEGFPTFSSDVRVSAGATEAQHAVDTSQSTTCH